MGLNRRGLPGYEVGNRKGWLEPSEKKSLSRPVAPRTVRFANLAIRVPQNKVTSSEPVPAGRIPIFQVVLQILMSPVGTSLGILRRIFLNRLFVNEEALAIDL
jgi:hypothetical protein